MKILVFNAGSSTYKVALYDLAGVKDTPQALWSDQFDFEAAKKKPDLRKFLKSCPFLNEIAAVGHRVVHGGNVFTEPVLITPKVKKTIRSLFDLAPLHNPSNLQGIEEMEKLFQDVPHIAVFDTAFHQTLPTQAFTYPLPKKWRQMGIRRFGFHGISHEWCYKKAKTLLKDSLGSKVLSCHLGNGASLAAIHRGKCMDTTMGFTPLEGLMMGTRSGSIDPAILLYLMREKHLTPHQLEIGLNEESGLKAIADTPDMRKILLRVQKKEKTALLAFEMYLQSLKRHCGAMIGSLSGIDTLIFTGGIGENAPLLRSKLCQSLNHLNLKIDERKNKSNPIDVDIASKDSKIRVLVIHTREDLAIAESTYKIIQNQVRNNL